MREGGLSPRALVARIIVIAIFAILALRLGYIQLIDDRYDELSDNNYLRNVVLYPPRGEIYDRNGELLAQNRLCYDVSIVRKDMPKSGFDTTQGFRVSGDSKFSSTVSQSFRAGFEIVPNRNDIRYYFRRCTYRAGLYYDQAYYKLDGANVNTMGVTLGITLPVFRLYNGLTLGVDFGQKAHSRNNMIRERYAMFVIGFNIHDIWFRKVQYN